MREGPVDEPASPRDWSGSYNAGPDRAPRPGFSMVASAASMGHPSRHNNKTAGASRTRTLTEEEDMNLLILVGLIILAYWVIAIAWVATREDWE